MSVRVLTLGLLLVLGVLLAPAAPAEEDLQAKPLQHTSKDPMKCDVCRPAYDKAMARVCEQLRRSSFPVKMICGWTLLADGRHERELNHCVDCAVGWRTHPGYRARSHPGNWYPALAGAFLAEVQKHHPQRRVREAMAELVRYFTEVQETTGGWWKWHEGAYKERLDYAVVDHGFITALVMGFFHQAQVHGVEVPEEVLAQGEACIERITSSRGIGYGTPRSLKRSGGDKTGGRGSLLLAGLAYAGRTDHRVFEVYRKVLPKRLPNLDQGHHVGALHGLAVTIGCHVLGPETYEKLIHLWLDRLIRKQEPDGGLYIGDDGDAGGEPKLLRGNVGSTAAFALMLRLQDHDRLVPPDRARHRDGSLTLNTSKELARRRAQEAEEARRRAAREARETSREVRAATEAAIREAAPPWNDRLVAQVERAVAEGRRIRFRSKAMKRSATIQGVDAKGRIRVSARGVTLPLAPSRLDFKERSAIARAVVRDDHPEDHDIAAFFALATGDVERGRDYLAKGGERAAEVATFYRGLGVLP